MKIGRLKEPEATEPRKGMVEIQWKCAENHKDCAARNWRFYAFAPEKEAGTLVNRYNIYTKILKYRVKPA